MSETTYLDYLFYVAKEIGIPPMDLEDLVRNSDTPDPDKISEAILNFVRNNAGN